jgi:autophagy-related protein 27
MRTTTLSITVPLLLSTLTSALTLDCTHIRVDKKKFNLQKLGGPHSIVVVDKDRPPAIHNTTYTVDICQQLERAKDIPKAEQCPRGTYGMNWF